MKNKKQCSIAIIGQPNVGKSTLINQIFNKKISIVSYKPQTTRNSIMALYEDNKIRILFVDTPGFHKPKTKLDSFLNSQIKTSLKNVTFVLFLIDSCKGFTKNDEILLNIIIPIVININVVTGWKWNFLSLNFFFVIIHLLIYLF